MTYLRNLLHTVFSNDVGLDQVGIDSALRAIQTNPDRRELNGLRAELKTLLEDQNADWIELLDNDEFEVYSANSNEDARQFVITNIWHVMFPDEDMDILSPHV